jgi:LuxR family transcriptional regulator, maltose regulon positive regulatory protein
VTLAQPGGFVRVFVDLGPNMADLMGRLAAKGVARDTVERILRAFSEQHASPQPQPAMPPPARATAQVAMIEPLTRREQQVLELLAQRMTAQEIARKLVVSDQTVKRHRANIYQKLGVHSRRDAIAAAVALSILPAASPSGPLE